jgi:hypothetical protein
MKNPGEPAGMTSKPLLDNYTPEYQEITENRRMTMNSFKKFSWKYISWGNET